MNQRFETFVTAISQIYRSLQRLKSMEMADFGLKGTHVMCLYQLQKHEEGLTFSQLAQLCDEDKAAISRTVSELRDQELAVIPDAETRKYKKRIFLTEKGKTVTVAMDQKIVDAVNAATQGYTMEERDIFIRVLLQVADNLQAACSQEDTK